MKLLSCDFPSCKSLSLQGNVVTLLALSRQQHVSGFADGICDGEYCGKSEARTECEGRIRFNGRVGSVVVNIASE
jgi:hypothetical protein